MSEFVTKDSGRREVYDNGFQRDEQAGKPRPDLISPFLSERLGDLLARGAGKYGERNWEKGQPFSRALASLERHLMQFKARESTEDHLAAVVFNAMALIHYQECIKRGSLPVTLDDLPKYDPPSPPKDWEAYATTVTREDQATFMEKMREAYKRITFTPPVKWGDVLDAVIRSATDCVCIVPVTEDLNQSVDAAFPSHPARNSFVPGPEDFENPVVKGMADQKTPWFDRTF